MHVFPQRSPASTVASCGETKTHPSEPYLSDTLMRLRYSYRMVLELVHKTLASKDALQVHAALARQSGDINQQKHHFTARPPLLTLWILPVADKVNVSSPG